MTSADAAIFEDAACHAARRGGEVLRRRFRKLDGVTVETKGMHDFVTEVDREAETAVLESLTARFPDHSIMSEEDSPDAAFDGQRWVVDPLDGTTNFIHGVTPFCVSVALEDTAGLVAGAIYDPVADELFHAHRGGGAFLGERRIECTRVTDSHDALLATGFPFRDLARLSEYLEAFEAFVRSTAGLRRAGSAAIDLAYTACGRYDGFWEVGLSRWDVAAGVLLVREAGGVVTDAVGGANPLDSGDVVAAGASLHPHLLGITSRSFG